MTNEALAVREVLALIHVRTLCAGLHTTPNIRHCPVSPLQVNANAVVAIEAHITSSEDLDATARWTLTDGVLDGFDNLGRAASSSLEYKVRLEPPTCILKTRNVAHLRRRSFTIQCLRPITFSSVPVR